jgi:transcriptional regulator with XRE-family HTH domain
MVSQATFPSLSQLDERRKALGMSRSALARRSGVSLPTVQRVLTGTEPTPSLPVVHALAQALGVQVNLGHDAAIRSTTSATEFRRQRALTKARQLTGMLQATMGLEAQAVAPQTLDDLTERQAEQLLGGSGRRLWDD